MVLMVAVEAVVESKVMLEALQARLARAMLALVVEHMGKKGPEAAVVVAREGQGEDTVIAVAGLVVVQP